MHVLLSNAEHVLHIGSVIAGPREVMCIGVPGMPGAMMREKDFGSLTGFNP